MLWSIQNGQRPEKFDESIFRSRGILQLFDTHVVNDYVARHSEPCQVGGFRHFTLYVSMISTGTPYNIHIEPEFLEPSTGCWHTYKQGLFAALFYEDHDCIAKICEVFNGDCAGRDFRVTLTGIHLPADGAEDKVDKTNYFTVDIAVEFWN